MSPESFLNFFLNLYIPPWLRKGFKFMMLRSLAITFVSQKIQSVHFYLYPKAKLSPRLLSLPPPPTQKGNFHSSRTTFSGDLFLPEQNGGAGGGGGWALGEDEDHGVEKVIKINLVRVLVTSSDKSHHL